jgi:hypothetical protein
MSNQVADTRYLFRKGRTWYVRISITPSLRHHYGGKECHVESTKCHDLRDAQVRRNEIFASFKRELHELKQGRSKDAAAWRQEYLGADADQVHMVDLGDGRVDRFTERELVHDLIADDAADMGRAKGLSEGMEFLRQATAEHTISEVHALWLGEVQQDRAGQTIANYKQALRELVAHVGEHVEPKEITRRRAGDFVSTKLVASGRAKRTQAKLISALATFWTWMRRRGYVDENPWEKQALPYKKQSQEDAVRAYTHVSGGAKIHH